jgi:D-alanyl-D-alanine carboxypeptidase
MTVPPPRPAGRSAARGRIAVACAVLAGAALAPAAAAAQTPRAHATAAGLRGQLRALVRMPQGPPGAIVVVQRGARRTAFTAGVPALGAGRRIRVTDHMRLASTAKAFSGAVTLSLVAQHKLSLDDTIAELLPQLPAAWGKVTLGEALQHTSGLPDLLHNDDLLDYLRAHPHATPKPLFLLHFLRHDPLRFTPGSEYHYSNTDNFVAALMARAVTHRTYRQLLRSRVYRPLGLHHTSLPAGFAMPKPYLHGYDPDPPQPIEDVSTTLSGAYSWASGGLVSTPADLTRFIRGYVGARLFSRAVQRQQLHFVKGDSEPMGPGTNSAGLAIFRYRTRCGTVYGHTGNTLGYTQFMAATLNGRRSVTASISDQATNKLTGDRLAVWKRLRQAETTAVCLALGKR